MNEWDVWGGMGSRGTAGVFIRQQWLPCPHLGPALRPGPGPLWPTRQAQVLPTWHRRGGLGTPGSLLLLTSTEGHGENSPVASSTPAPESVMGSGAPVLRAPTCSDVSLSPSPSPEAHGYCLLFPGSRCRKGDSRGLSPRSGGPRRQGGSSRPPPPPSPIKGTR